MSEGAVSLSADDEATATRRNQWHHAARVLAVPEFITLSWMTDSSGVLDLMITACERDTRHIEVMALADHWILGFFEILRIACSPDYKKLADAEFTIGAEIEGLRNRANMVRSAFAKLRLPGKRRYILPSHSEIGGDKGVVYAVYDNEGREIDINRRELADEFLVLLGRLPPSRRLAERMKSLGRSIESLIVPL